MKIGDSITHENVAYVVAAIYKNRPNGEPDSVRLRTHGYPSHMIDVPMSELEPETKPTYHSGTFTYDETGAWQQGKWNGEELIRKLRSYEFSGEWNFPGEWKPKPKQLPLPTTEEGTQYYDINELLNEITNEGEEEMQETKPTGADPYAAMFGGIIEEAQKRVEKAVDDKMDGELADLRKAIKEKQTLEIKMGEVTGEVKGTRHRQLPELLKLAGLRLPTLMIGMAGTGKTHAAEQVAEGLELEFYSMSVGAQTSKSDIIGYMNANGDYVSTHFRTAYEKGGVFLMDEIDAGNANVLIQINAALSNGKAAFPDAMVKAHEDFVFIASANTYGTGANRQYVGRNQLDAATLDRFTVLNWDIDVELEQKLSGENTNWYAAVGAVRMLVAKEKIRALITPRATVRGARLLATGMDLNNVIESALLGTVPDDKKQQVKEAALMAYSGGTPGIGSGRPSRAGMAKVAF